MPRYLYIAKTRQGETKKGILEATNEHDLAKILREKGYVLVRAEIEGKKLKTKIPLVLSSVWRVSLVEKTMFVKNLKVMIASGIPLPRALGILSEQTRSKKFKKILLKIKEDVIKGSPLSDVIVKYPNIFPDVFANMIKVGEESGTLEKVLDILVNQMEKEHDIKSKVKGAMIYPAVILFAMTVIGILMLILVVPKLSKLFEELDLDLPLMTKIVMTIGNFLSSYWYFIPVLIVVLIFAFRASLKTKIGKRSFDKFTLSIPIISPIVKKTYAAITVRTLSSLVSAGVPIVRSLEIVSGTLGNVYYKEAIANSAKEVQTGKKLAEALSVYKDIYPILVVQMIAVGEETGETSAILAKLAEFFEQEVSNITKNLSSVVEPILMLIIGAVVGFFAISMVQPMYSLMDGI